MVIVALFIIVIGLPYVLVYAICFLAVGFIFTFMRLFGLLNLIISTPILIILEKGWPDCFSRRTIPEGFKYTVEKINEDWKELNQKYWLD